MHVCCPKDQRSCIHVVSLDCCSSRRTKHSSDSMWGNVYRHYLVCPVYCNKVCMQALQIFTLTTAVLACLQILIIASLEPNGGYTTQDHYKGYKHQRMVARQGAAARNPGYNTANVHSGAARRMAFTPQHQPHLADLGYSSPSRSPYPYPNPHPADRWQTG